MRPTNHQLEAVAGSNGSFSRLVPGLQVAVDSTSLGEFKTCPRKYLFGIVLGYTPRDTSVHLLFGLWVHRGLEIYSHAKVEGLGHEDALDRVVDWALRVTWDKAKQRPWLGDPLVPEKSRLTLLRTLVWYMDTYGENDPIETIVLANGRPAVELSFRFDSGYVHESSGEPVFACGHLDRLGRLNDQVVIVDPKTTKTTLGSHWFAKFTPGNQFSMYTLGGQVAFQQPVSALIVDGIQVLVGSTRFQREIIPRPRAVVEEWHRELGWWLRQMEGAALAGEWPGNDKACDLYGGCPFRSVCSRPPGARQGWLDGNFTRRVWDPLQVRGEL